METFKSILFTIIGLGILFFVGLWAFSSIESGSDHVNSQEIKRLKDENQELKNEIAKLTTANSLLTAKDDENTKIENEVASEQVEVKEEPVKPTKPTTTTTTTTTTKTLKYQELIDGLQVLVNKGVILERGNQGPSVGLVQKFLNAYNGTSLRIDNDFVKTTETAVKAYQKAVGMTADGKVGKTTFLKMITWLKSKG
jgi:murein L,D-transpeptidase YcbB/YkuD